MRSKGDGDGFLPINYLDCQIATPLVEGEGTSDPKRAALPGGWSPKYPLLITTMGS